MQAAVKKETGFITAGTLGACAVLILVFYLLHKIMPKSVPFGYTVVLGALCGGIVASLNFFLMSISVQRIAEATKGYDLSPKPAPEEDAKTEESSEGTAENIKADDTPQIPQELRDRAYAIMKTSYRGRMLMQLAWVVLAIVLPCFQFVAGIAPLFFPSLLIKARGFLTGTQNT